MRATDLLNSILENAKINTFESVESGRRLVTTVMSGWMSQKQANLLFELINSEGGKVYSGSKFYYEGVCINRAMPNKCRSFRKEYVEDCGLTAEGEDLLNRMKKRLAEGYLNNDFTEFEEGALLSKINYLEK